MVLTLTAALVLWRSQFFPSTMYRPTNSDFFLIYTLLCKYEIRVFIDISTSIFLSVCKLDLVF